MMVGCKMYMTDLYKSKIIEAHNASNEGISVISTV